MNPVYGIPAALELFDAAGAGMSRQAFYQSILPHLAPGKWAEKVGSENGGTWVFDRVYLQHWAEYVAEVRKRREAGTLPKKSKFSEFDMQCFIDGAWDDD